MMGSNRDETSFFLIGLKAPSEALSEAGFDVLVEANLGNKTLKELKALYEPGVYPYPAALGDFSRW